MSPGSSTESYPAFAHIGLRENPGKNLNQILTPKSFSLVQPRSSQTCDIILNKRYGFLRETNKSLFRFPKGSNMGNKTDISGNEGAPGNERIPNLSAKQSDGITVFRISPMASLMLHRCRTGAISLQK
ncbi:hypothetical protein ANN_22056 [Periplaneta americana]|uniref:Uncharacterized protein n=1 Tax=Periplaneta americana TaxID=6978 RepID=A0ABQ8S724_PERAM|nr:hypothetical protein ANN_22056 [Periplaneta americana]